MSKKFVNPTEFIQPININGMEGRVLRVESSNRHNRREILLIYDLDSNLEKWWGLTMALKTYAHVTVVDLPGIGGMDSFYSIGLKPTLNNMADYLASFIKLSYKRKRLTVMGIGFGFAALTRMMQRNPDVASKVNLVISLNGYGHHDDFKLTPQNKLRILVLSRLSSVKLPAFLLKLIMQNTPMLKLKFPTSSIKQSKHGPPKKFIRRFQIDLGLAMDYRTSMFLKGEIMRLDNCKKPLNTDLWHVSFVGNEPRVDQRLAEQHFKIIFNKYYHIPSKVRAQMPVVLNDPRLATKYLPAKLRRALKARA